MKNPTLMRFLSFILIFLLLVSSIIAAFQIVSLKQEGEKERASIDSLSETFSEYQAAVKKIEECGIDYEKITSELEQLQEGHTETVSDHKTELSQYTAEKSGYLQGADALWEAKAAMPEAWAEFTAAKDAFYEKYNAFYEGKAQLEQYSWLFENYDSISAVFNSILSTAEELSGQIQAAESWIASDENIESAAESINAQIDSVKNALDSLIASVNQLPEEERNELNQAVAGMTGMTLEELSATLNQMDSITPEEIRNSFNNLAAQLAAGSESVKSQALEYLNQYAQLNETWQTMLANEPMLISGKEAIDAAEQQLLEGENTIQSSLEEIWYQLGQLDIEKSELEDEKEALEEEAERLADLSVQAAQYENLSNAVDNLKAKLTGNDYINSAVEGGLSIDDACELVCIERAKIQDGKDKDLIAAAISFAISLGCGIISAVLCLMKKPAMSILFIFLLLCALFQAFGVWYNYKITESVLPAGALVSIYAVFEAFILMIPIKIKRNRNPD